MVYATADGSAASKLRIGMVGGGRGAFIGAVHRMAMRLDEQIALVAGALSSDPANAAASAGDLGIAPDRAYSDYREMARAEAARPDGIEAIAIVTPNHLHAPIAAAFLEAGIDVICDKPLATSMEDALALVRLTAERKRKFFVTLNNTGYPMIRQAREMVAAGELGRIVATHVTYIQDWLTEPVDVDGSNKQAVWRTDPQRAGESAVLADIGVHAVNLATYTTGAQPQEVSADLFTVVPGRRMDDNAHLMVRWSNGARGSMVVSQTSPGNYNDVMLRIYGEKGGLHWVGIRPEELRFARTGEEATMLVRGGHSSTAEGRRASRMPAAHPEGYIEAFANLYRDAAMVIRAHRSGLAADPAIESLLPDVVEGARGMKFVHAAVESSRAGGAWTSAVL